MKKIIFLFSISVLLCNPTLLLAQAPVDTLAVAENKFEDSFYESLKQEGIENYDKAVIELEKCLNLQPNNDVVLFELGRNHYYQKKYNQAYDYFEQATKINPKNRWYWAGMYDVCYDTQDWNKAIVLVQKLIEFKANYKEDLVSLYMKTAQFDKALALINELNATVGKDEKRELYKADILRNQKYQGSEKDNLMAQIKQNPKVESNYVDLIYLYSQSGQEDKALEIAKQLETEIPTSDWAQVSLFKFHISNNEGDLAVKSMNIILASNKIDSKIKHRVLNEFLIYSESNPQYVKDLDKAISYFDNDKQVNVPKEIGKFFQNKKDIAKASKYYEMSLKNTPNDMETILLALQAYTEIIQFDKVAKLSDEQMQLFPTQPDLYYYNGLANNQLKNYKKAKDALESGLDFVVDNPTLEINFNLQLVEAYNGLGDLKKKDVYFSKANELIKKQKK